MKQHHTVECLDRKAEVLSHGLGNDCELAGCDCACHADPEPFNESDNRYKWPEDRR